MSPLYNRINQVANGFLSISKRKGNALDQLGSSRFIFRHFSGDAVDSSGSRDCNQRFFGSKQNRKSQLSVMSPLHFHYEDVLRQDMLLKLNYANVMEVPGLCEIRLAPKVGASSDSQMKFGKLAMEILCSQRFFNAKRAPNFQAGKSPRYNSHLGSEKDTSGFARQSALRGHEMSNFLVRILTVMSMLDSQVQIGENSIKFSMEKEFCEFSPELEDHFEIFEHIGGFNVTIATSANTKDETLLLWSGFLLKDERETK